MPQVYSTLANHQIYNVWKDKGKGKVNVRDEDRKIVIAGGTGVIKKNGTVPIGVVTEITEAQHEDLKGNHTFNAHVKAGHLIVTSKRVDPEVMAADMNTRDELAQAIPADLAEMAPTVELESETTRAKRGK